MHIYRITGNLNCNDADTDDGNLTVEIDENVEVSELGAESALRLFFADNPQYDDFFALKTCDQDTRGNKGASFIDRTDATRSLDVDLVV